MSTRFVYHAGTGTYWSFDDDWYIVDAPNSVAKDAAEYVEEYLGLICMAYEGGDIDRAVQYGPELDLS